MSGQSEQNNNIVVDESNSNIRLDILLSEQLDVTRSQAQKIIKAQSVQVNGVPAKAKVLVQAGDEIVISGDAALGPPSLVQPVKMDLEIVYEDNDLIVVNKPSNLVVHPGAGTKEPTLIEGVLYHLDREAHDLPGDWDRPGIVHRLDKDTTGVIVIAKHRKCHSDLAKQFHDKTNIREYFAICRGVMAEAEKVHESYLNRDENHRTRFRSHSLDSVERLEDGDQAGYRYAKSTFRTKKSYASCVSLLQVKLDTGRTHQIRIHAKDLGIPIVGDTVYGTNQAWPGRLPKEVKFSLSNVKRQMLHARLLGFTHPMTGKKLAFEVPLPKDMSDVVQVLESHRV